MRGDDVFVPTEMPEVGKNIEAVQAEVEAFIDTARERYARHTGDSGVGSEIDQSFDTTYDNAQQRLIELAGQPGIGASAEAQRSIGEARFRLANAHLFLEELLSGDDEVSKDAVLADFRAGATAARSLGSVAGSAVDVLRDLASERLVTAESILAADNGADAAFDNAFETFIAQAEAAEELIHDAMATGVANLDDTNTSTLVEMIAVAVVAVTLAILFTILMSRSVTARLRHIAGAMSTIGAMARAVEVFKGNALQMREMRASETA